MTPPSPARFGGIRRLLWRLLAVVCVGLGLLGAVLPLLPSVPFLLVAAWAAGHGWPALERWLLNHPRFGPPVRRWRERGAVPRRAKWAASVMMTFSATLVVLLPNVPSAVRLGVPLLLAGVAAWLWTRPE
jgi:uncharacterized membrane protein YbaN (DUF454 family)